MLLAQVVFRNTVALSWTDQRRKYVTDGRRTSSFLSTLFSSSPLLLFWACHGEGAGGGGGVLCNSLRGSWRRPETNRGRRRSLLGSNLLHWRLRACRCMPLAHCDRMSGGSTWYTGHQRPWRSVFKTPLAGAGANGGFTGGNREPNVG